MFLVQKHGDILNSIVVLNLLVMNLLPIRELKKIGNILNRFSIKSVVQVVSDIAEGVTTSLANKYLPEEISKFKP